LRIYDTTGKLIATPLQGKKHKAGVHETKVDLKDFQRGVYFATMRNSDGETQTVKFVVDK
jgi:mannitol/fructose-specific phosphotransferase system IIA component